MMRFGGKYAHIRACHAFHMFSSKCTTMTCNRMSSRRRRRLLPVNLYSLLLFLFTTSLPVGYSFFTPRANSINCQPPYSKSSPLQHRYGRTFLQNIRKSRICLVQMSFLSSTAAPVSATAHSPVHQAPARQSILVLGAGAVGSLYGGRLCEAGHDVTFLMRREYDAVAATGLRISSPDGDMFFPQPSIARSIEEVAVSRARRARRKGAGEGGGGEGKGDQAGGMAGDAERRKVVEETRDIEGAEGEAYVPVDWVIVTLKSSSFHAIPSLLKDRRVVGNATRILVLMNGYGLEEDLVGQGIDGKRVFGGMAFVCANRGPVGSGEIAHLKYGKLMIGHYEDDPVELSLVAGLFKGAKVEVETTPCLLHGRWSKCCWNIPFNGLGCILGGKSVDHIVQTPELRRLATLVMADVVKVANVELGGREGGQEGGREGGKIEPSFQEHLFALTDAMGPYMSSTVLDLLGGLPMETEYMFLRPLKRAEALGVEVPYLEGVALAVEGIRKSRGL